MQIFKTTRGYALVFSAYAFIALATLHNLFRKPGASITHSPFSTQIPEIVGMLCCAIVLPGLLRKTSNTIERVVLILTEVVCLLWLANVLPKAGLDWAVIPYEHYFSATLVCASALLAGVRLVGVVRQ